MLINMQEDASASKAPSRVLPKTDRDIMHFSYSAIRPRLEERHASAFSPIWGMFVHQVNPVYSSIAALRRLISRITSGGNLGWR